MAYFLANLGRRWTQSQSVTLLVSPTSAGLTPPVSMQFREVGQPWTAVLPYRPYFRMGLSDGAGDKTIECRLTDSLSNVEVLTQVVTLVENADPGFSWRPVTQAIANNLPVWHPGRRLRTSNWQKFMNIPAAATSLLQKKLNDLSSALFLSTANTDEIDQVVRSWPDPFKMNVPRQKKNLVDNPSLGLLYQPFGEPKSWALSDIDSPWVLDRDQPLMGRFSLRSSPPDAGDRSTLTQELDVTLDVGEKLTATIYYKNDLPFTGAALPADVDYHVRLIVLYEDGSSDESITPLVLETEEHWQDTQVSLIPTARVTKAWLVINVDHIASMGAFNTWVGGATAYVGEDQGWGWGTTSPWWIASPASVDLEPPQETWFTTDPNEFWDEAIPTRVGAVGTTANAGPWAALQAAPVAYPIKDALRQDFTIGYQVVSGRIGMFEASSQSLLKEFNLALYDEGTLGYRTIEGLEVDCLTFFRGRLWAVVHFTDSAALARTTGIRDDTEYGEPVDNDNRTYYLAIVNHLVPASMPDYMEIISILPLTTDAIGAPPVQLDFVADDPQWVWFRTTGSEHYVRLYYDYAMPRPDGSMWFREV